MLQDLNSKIAVATVYFRRPLTGNQLAQLARVASESIGYGNYVQAPRYRDGDCITMGHSSYNTGSVLIPMPEPGNKFPFFSTEGVTYRRAYVTEYDWHPDGGVVESQPHDDDIINFIKRYADALLKADMEQATGRPDATELNQG